ncbi:MAG: hypothetical protein IJX83_09120, partial [Lachnospiraceae bacterium]|nr:hypothetical protein [Clostridia bacterium]MBQ8329762.1 hypothetical protein [Lachnospiraceae bacterium]
VVGIVGKSKSLDFPTMLIFWSLVRNSVVLAVYLLFSVACFLTVHEHSVRDYLAVPASEDHAKKIRDAFEIMEQGIWGRLGVCRIPK